MDSAIPGNEEKLPEPNYAFLIADDSGVSRLKTAMDVRGKFPEGFDSMPPVDLHQFLHEAVLLQKAASAKENFAQVPVALLDDFYHTDIPKWTLTEGILHSLELEFPKENFQLLGKLIEIHSESNLLCTSAKLAGMLRLIGFTGPIIVVSSAPPEPFSIAEELFHIKLDMDFPIDGCVFKRCRACAVRDWDAAQDDPPASWNMQIWDLENFTQPDIGTGVKKILENITPPE